MKTATIDRPPAVETRAAKDHERSRPVADFAELVKAQLTLLVLVTTAVGFYLGARETTSYLGFFHAVFGTALAAAGAAALNQWWERAFDALMHRTKQRPIPGGRMLPRDALAIGTVLAAGGVAYLAIATNALAAVLAAATILIYIFAYTPLKRISTTNTLVGAIPGALPPMIGWAAARGSVEWPAWSLFAILFCWQMPHFFAIAWMYRDDYARAGFRMLSNSDADGARSGRQSVIFALSLVVASCLPALFQLTSRNFLAVEALLSLCFAALAVRFARRRGAREARQLFVASIIYLPLLLLVLVATRS